MSEKRITRRWKINAERKSWIKRTVTKKQQKEQNRTMEEN